jgi:NADH-quinone oxidoreductase subunit I
MTNKRAENVKSGPVTLERVAKLAGVSPSTVSRILNGTAVVSDEKKKAIDALVYRLELCTMCNLCIVACPSDAIKMAPNFEHSVFDRTKLTKVLNHPGSKIKEGIE